MSLEYGLAQMGEQSALEASRGGLHHLHIAAVHRRTRVLAIADVTTIALDTGEILATHTINPDRYYWPNTQKEPSRWPSSS